MWKTPLLLPNLASSPWYRPLRRASELPPDGDPSRDVAAVWAISIPHASRACHVSATRDGGNTWAMGQIRERRFAAEMHRYRRRLMEFAGLVRNNDRRDNQPSPLPEPCLRDLTVEGPEHVRRRAQGFALAIQRRLSEGPPDGPTGEEAARVAATIDCIGPVLEELTDRPVTIPHAWTEWRVRYESGEME